MQRFREQLMDPIDFVTKLRWRQTNTAGQWGSWNANAVGGGTFQGYKKMWDSTNPGFFKAEREGDLKPVAPMSMEQLDWSISMGGSNLVVKRDSTGILMEIDLQGYYRNNAIRPVPVPPSADTEVLLQEALSRAQTDAWDALTFVAEFRSTLETVVGFRERTDRLYDRFASKVSSRMRGRKAADRAKVISDVWLELRYAWRPMLYDMQDIGEALKRLSEGVEDPLQRAYASQKLDALPTVVTNTSQDIVVPGWGQVGLSGFRVDAVLSTAASTSAHAAVGVQVTTRDVTLVDPLITAWELVPFSFVLDWFVTIGSILSAFSPFATGQLRYSTISTRTETVSTSNYTLRPNLGWTLVSGGSSTSVRLERKIAYNRAIEDPQPTLAFQVNLDVLKIFDLVALWSSRNQTHLRRILRHI
jgi:hypothetical protein